MLLVLYQCCDTEGFCWLLAGTLFLDLLDWNVNTVFNRPASGHAVTFQCDVHYVQAPKRAGHKFHSKNIFFPLNFDFQAAVKVTVRNVHDCLGASRWLMSLSPHHLCQQRNFTVSQLSVLFLLTWENLVTIEWQKLGIASEGWWTSLTGLISILMRIWACLKGDRML